MQSHHNEPVVPTSNDKPLKDVNVELAQERTEMANFRTQLALDRTALAWVRTSLTFATFGFAMVGFFRSLQDGTQSPEINRLYTDAVLFGAAFVIVGIVAMVISGVSHWRALQRLRKGLPPRLARLPLSLLVAGLVVVLAIVGLWGVFLR